MTVVELIQTTFKSKEILLHGVCGARIDQLTDYTAQLITQEIEPYLSELVSKKKKEEIEENVLSILIDLADRALQIGVDTATMTLAGIDPYNTYRGKREDN